MMPETAPSLDRGGVAPSITSGCATIHSACPHEPQRLVRTRKKFAFTPPGAIYVGRPTIFANPFERRRRIGHARSVILYRAWLRGDLSDRIIRAAGFSQAEADALRRWHTKLLHRLPQLAGRDLQCWCPLTSPWCHADVLLDLATRRVVQ